jgi:hypothetical protein
MGSMMDEKNPYSTVRTTSLHTPNPLDNPFRTPQNGSRAGSLHNPFRTPQNGSRAGSIHSAAISYFGSGKSLIRNDFRVTPMTPF